VQSIKILSRWLSQNANDQHYLFALRDLRPLFPDLSESAFKTLLSRAGDSGLLHRVCRGVYLYKEAYGQDGLLLFHIASLLRADMFNYISLETVLSDAGIISQIPINLVTLMSSGRSNFISCGKFGSIEFIHTQQKPLELMSQLTYDNSCGLWKASVYLALRDMKMTRRNSDLIDWNLANELI